jgi:ornithine--oxo-acid transaminase
VPTSKDYMEMDDKYCAHNYHPIPVVISKAEGVWVYDPEGNKYIDCLSAYSSQNTGHCHPEIIKALKEQADKVTLTSRAFYNDMMGPFLKKLCEVVGPHINDPNNSGIMALPMNTGTEAVSSGLKVARAWGYIKKKIPKNEAKIIVCRDNFHGRSITIAGFSTDIEAVRYYGNFGPYTPGFVIIPYGDAEELENTILEIGPEEVAAFLFEPIQGEAGVKVPPEGFIKKVREICTKYDVLMIADEIQTGFGRTGELFGCDHENVKPDAILLGGTHGSTFGGNPLASAVAMKSLEIHIDDHLAQRAKEFGGYFLEGLRNIAKKKTIVPIKEVRGKGLLLAIEFESDARHIVEMFKDNGVLAKHTHSTIIRFAPPLIITKDQIAWALKIIENVLVA